MALRDPHPDPNMKLLVMIPCYNEEKSICESLLQLDRAQQKFMEGYHQKLDILIVDDGSADQTANALKCHKDRYDFTLITHPYNCGYGKALQAGFAYAKAHGYDWIITFDMDGQHEPTFLYRFYERILQTNGSAHIISGSRYKDPGLFWKPPWKDRFLVNAVVTAIFNYLGMPLTDSFCGMKAHRVEEINWIDFTLDGYEMPIEMLLKANHMGLKIEEMAVPVIYKSRNGVITNERATRFIFARAESRLAKYLGIIHELEPSSKKIALPVLAEIYRKYYRQYAAISPDNFTDIQQAIIHEVATQFGACQCNCIRCKSMSPVS